MRTGLILCALLLRACDPGTSPIRPSTHLPAPQQTEQSRRLRFFSGQALPGEFRSLKDLPTIPATFDEESYE